MAAIGVRELKAKTSEIIRRSEKGEAFLVTRRGRPVSVVLPFDEETEDLILAQAPYFVRLRSRAREQYRKGLTIPWRELRRELLPKPKTRAVARRAR